MAAVWEDGPGSRLLAAPVLDLNYGWGDTVQLKLEIPWLWKSGSEDSDDGLGRWEVGVKWRFFESALGGLRASIYPQAAREAPGTARAFADEGAAFVLPVQVAGSVSVLEISGELGYALHEGEPDEWLAGIAAEHPLHKRASLVAEVYGRWREHESDVVAANLGVEWRLMEETNVLMSVGRALRRPATVGPRLSAYVGVQLLR